MEYFFEQFYYPKPPLLLKKDSMEGISLKILRCFSKQLINRIPVKYLFYKSS